MGEACTAGRTVADAAERVQRVVHHPVRVLCTDREVLGIVVGDVLVRGAAELVFQKPVP